MGLMVHSINNNRKMQKVFYFCWVSSHTGKNLAKTVEHCLSSWRLNCFFTLTVDNISSNEVESFFYIDSWQYLI